MPTVEIPGVGDVDFPDSMDQTAIRDAAAKIYAKHGARPKSEFLGQPPGYVPDTLKNSFLQNFQQGVNATDTGITKFLNTPTVDIGKFATEHTDPASAISAPVRGAANVAGSLTSPGALALMALTGGLPGAAAKAAAGGFAAKTAIDTAKAVPDILAAAKSGDVPAAVEKGTEAALNLGMAGLAGKHALGIEGAPEPVANIVGEGPKFSPEQEQFYQTHRFEPEGIQGQRAVRREIPMGNAPDGMPVVQKPNGDIVKELQPASPGMAQTADAVLAEKYGTVDLQKIADKWRSENDIKEPVDVTVGKSQVAQTSVNSDGSINVTLSQDRATPLYLLHELEMHVAKPEGDNVAALMPHDDATNENLAEAVVSSGGAPPQKPPIGFAGVGHPDSEGDYLGRAADVNPSAAAVVFGQRRTLAQSAADTFLRNLNALDEHLPEAAMAAREKASAPGTAHLASLGGNMRIQGILGGGRPDLELFHAAMNQGMQEGTRSLYLDLAKKAVDLPADEIKMGLPDAVIEPIQRNSAFSGIPIRKTLNGLIANGNIAGARMFLSDIFHKAADQVRDVEIPGYKSFADYEANAPGGRAAVAEYGRIFGPIFEKAQAQQDGVFRDPKYLPGGFYYPTGEPTGIPAWKVGTGVVPDLTNKQDFFHTGFAPKLDVTPEGFTARLQRILSSSARNTMIEQLKNSPLWTKVSDADLLPQDVPNPSVRYTLPGRTVVKDGAFLREPPQDYAMPAWLWDEIKPIIENPAPSAGLFRRVSTRLTGLNVTGPLEPAYHSYNLIGGAINYMPVVGDSLLAKASATPILGAVAKNAWLAGKMIGLGKNPSEALPDYIPTLVRASEMGMLPKKIGSVTLSKDLADLSGAKKTVTPFGPFLYGVDGLHARMMYLLTKSMDEIPGMTKTDYAQAASHFGTYTSELASKVERALKAPGIAPFLTAGKTGLWNGLDVWLNAGRGAPLKPSTVLSPAVMRAAQNLSTGTAGLVIGWMLAYKAYRNKWPWEDDESRFLSIPVNDEDRNGWLAKQLWPDEDKTAYVGWGFFNPTVGRGANALGITGAFNTAVAHGNGMQIGEAALKQTLNSWLHPIVNSPPLRIGMAGAVQAEPQFQALSERGKPAVKLYQYPGRASTFGGLVGNRLRAMAHAANPFFGTGGELAATGRTEQDRTALRYLLDIVTGGRLILGPYKNPSDRLEKDAMAAERAADASH